MAVLPEVPSVTDLNGRESSGSDECKQHDRRLDRCEGMWSAGRHVEPGARCEIEVFAVDNEVQLPRQNLHNGIAARLVLGEPLSNVKGKDGDIEVLVSMDDLRDDRARLNLDVGSREMDRVCHAPSFSNLAAELRGDAARCLALALVRCRSFAMPTSLVGSPSRQLSVDSFGGRRRPIRSMR